MASLSKMDHSSSISDRQKCRFSGDKVPARYDRETPDAIWDGLPKAVSDRVTLLRDAATRRTLLRRYFSKRVSDPTEIEDLIQEVYLRIANSTLQTEVENVSGYIYRIAGSILADRYRRRSVRCAGQHTVFEPELHGETYASADRILEDRQALAAAIDALRMLPERTRMIFIMRRIDGLAYKEIACRSGITVSAVEKQLGRAARHMVEYRMRHDPTEASATRC